MPVTVRMWVDLGIVADPRFRIDAPRGLPAIAVLSFLHNKPQQDHTVPHNCASCPSLALHAMASGLVAPQYRAGRVTAASVSLKSHRRGAIYGSVAMELPDRLLYLYFT